MKSCPFTTSETPKTAAGMANGRNGPPLTGDSSLRHRPQATPEAATRTKGRSDQLVFLELLAEAIGSMVAMKEVTSVAATSLRQHENLGSLVPGRSADFRVVDGDPLRDVRARRKLTTIYRSGVAHDPTSCWRQCHSRRWYRVTRSGKCER